MAWNMSTAKRRALVKLQLRDKNGRWIEMGGGVKWYSSKLKKVIGGTVVGTQGDSALVRLNKENPTHEPALVKVPAHNIVVVDSKASISIPGKNAPADATPEFEKPKAVGLKPNTPGSFVKPSDSPEDYGITTTEDGRTYISRKDGAELYFPARSLDIGDEIIAVEGADATKPFSIGKGWARKKTEAVNTNGPKMGTVVDINGDRYAVVQLADGVVVDDPKNPGQKTNKVTVGLSNSVIKATDGLKQALGGAFDDEGFSEDDATDEEEIDPSEENNSDHVGREVPEEEDSTEEDPAADVEVDIAEATKAAEPDATATPDEDAPIREEEDPEAKAAAEADLARRVAEREAKRKELGDQYDENGLTEDEAKMVSAYDRLAAGASDPDRAANYFDKAEALRETGKKRLGEGEKPAEKPKEAPQTAPEPEAERQSDSNDLEAPKEKSEAEKQFEETQDEIRDLGQDDSKRKAADSATNNATDSEREGTEKYSDDWYDIWNSSYSSALEDNKAEEDSKARQQGQDQSVGEEDAYSAARYKPAILSITTRGNTRGEMEYFDEVARESEIDQGYHMDGNKFVVTDLDKAAKAIDNVIDVWNDKQESAQKGGYAGETPAKIRSVLAGLEKLDSQVREAKRNKDKHASRFDGNYDIMSDRRLGKVRPDAERSDYAVDNVSDELVKAIPVGGTLTVLDPDSFYAGIPVVKIDDNVWARSKGLASRDWDFFDDFEMAGDDYATGVNLPDGPRGKEFSEKELNDARRTKEKKDRDDKAFDDNWEKHQANLKAEKSAQDAPAKEEAPKKEQAPLAEGDQFELPLPGIQKQGKRDDKSAAHKKTLDGLEEGDRVSYTNGHDETSTYQKHADGTWDLLDPEDEWEDQSPLEEALTSDEVAARAKRLDLEVATVADREEAERDANYKRRLRGDDYMKSNPDPVRRQNNGDEGQSRSEQEAQDANSADQPWSADEIQGTMRDWFDFAQAVKNGDTRAVETMANNKRTGDEETDIIVNDKGQPFDLTLTYNDDGDPVVRLSNFDDSKDIYGDFEIDSSVMPKQLATLIHESINADDPRAAIAERNGSNDPVDDPSVGRSYEVSSHIGEGKNYLAKAIEDHGDSGIVINGTTADVTDLDKAQDFLRDAVLDVQGKISDPAARKNSKIELNKAQRNLNKILADVNAKQFQRDGVIRSPKWMRDRADSAPTKSEDTSAPEAEAPKATEAPKANVPLADLETQAKADGDTVLYHGGLPDGTTLDDIDLNRNGSQQNKRGRSFGGFYLTDESSKSWSDDYAMKRNGVMHGFVVDKNARIDDRGSQQIDRLSAEDRAEAAKTADVIKGKDLLGRTQYVLLNKDVIKGVGETNMKDEKSSEDSAPEADAPEAPAAPEESAPEAEAPAPVDIVDHLNENAVLGDDAERRAAGLYLGGARYNSVLRDSAESGKEIHPHFQEQIDTLTGFIEKQPEFGQETKLYRGMSAKFLPDAENRIGDVVTEPAFLSTSLKRDQAELFSGVGGGVLMEITARPQDKGLSVNVAQMQDQSDIPEEYRAPVDVTAREAEILMKPGTSLKITGVEEVNGTKVVRAEVVDAPSNKEDAEIIPAADEAPEVSTDTPEASETPQGVHEGQPWIPLEYDNITGLTAEEEAEKDRLLKASRQAYTDGESHEGVKLARQAQAIFMTGHDRVKELKKQYNEAQKAEEAPAASDGRKTEISDWKDSLDEVTSAVQDPELKDSGNFNTAGIQKLNGLDGNPTVVSDREAFDALPGKKLFRGVGSEADAEKFMTGPNWVGAGGSGSGIYTSTNKFRGETFKRADGGALMEMKLSEGANIVDGDTLEAERKRDLEAAIASDDTVGQYLADGDLGKYAAARGLDGYSLKPNDPYEDGEEFVVLTNRAAVSVLGKPVESAEDVPETSEDSSEPTLNDLGLTPEEYQEYLDKTLDADLESRASDPEGAEAFSKEADAILQRGQDRLNGVESTPEEAPAEAAPAAEPESPSIDISPEDKAQLDELNRAMEAAVEADDEEAFDKASDAYQDLMDVVAKKNKGTYVDPDAEEEAWANPLDAMDIVRRTPEAIEGEKYPPTQQQQDVIDAVLAGLDTKVQAMAGTGKTSTLVALSRRLTKEGKKAVYIAFNKTVQEEAEERMKGLLVEAKTGHGTAHTWARTYMPHLTTRLANKNPMQPIKFDKKTNEATDWADTKAVSSSREIANILGIENNDIHEESGIPLSKSTVVLAVKKTVGSFQLSDKDEILPEHVPDSFEIAEADKPKIVEFANAYWDDLSREDGVFRMEHDTYRKHWALSRPDLTDGTGGNTAGASVLYIDEAQDTPPVLAKVVADQKMQKVIVGDQNQAIYAFAENIDYLSEADGDVELPLDKSWRFGPQVADIGNRFLQMLDSDSRVVGGGPESKIVYGMEDADAVLVRTNAGMIQVILEESKRNRKVAAPPGTRADLIRMADTVENLRNDWPGENPHDDLLGFKNWNEVMAAHENGDRSVSKIVSMFDEGSAVKRGMIRDYPAFLEQQMANVRKAIDSLVMHVEKYNDIKIVKEGNRTYLEAADHVKKKEYAVLDFSAEVGRAKNPWAAKSSMSWYEKKKAYHDAAGIGKEGWRFDPKSKRWYTDDADVAASIERYSGEHDVVVSTAHKSKGLEWDRVRISDDFRAPYEDKSGAMVWPEDDEYKLAYVAVTRAAKELDPGILDYVFAHTQENGGNPKKKKSTEDSTPAPEQVEEEAAPTNIPDEVAAEETDIPEPEAPESESDPEPVVEAPAPVAEPEPEVAPAPVAPAPEPEPQEEPVITPDLVDAPEPVSEPEPQAPAPAPVATPAPEFDDEGLTPQERRRANELERWINEVYRFGKAGNVEAMENELFDLLERGEKRMNPAPEVPVVAPAARQTTKTPKNRAPRGTYTDTPLMDTSGKQIQMGDIIGHPRLGPVAVTGFVPHSGRITFIDPVTNKEASVKAAIVTIVNPDLDEEITDLVGQPGERFSDPATGKKAFYNGDGQPIVTGQRVVDPRSGRTGTVVSVYPGADGLASVPVQWDDAPKPAKPTRVKGIILKLAGV
jgi:hypothetical protein